MGQKLRAEITGSILASDQTDIRKNKFGIVPEQDIRFYLKLQDI